MGYHGAMRFPSVLAATALTFGLLAAPAFGHEAKLDKLGCHHVSTPPGFHCHAGALAGRSFPTKWDAMQHLEESRDAPGWSWPDFVARIWRLISERETADTSGEHEGRRIAN